MAAPGLREIQRRFWYAVTAPVKADELLEWVDTANGIDQQTRLRVYASAYFSRLRDALARDYPRLRAFLGVRRFDRFASDYLAKYPSTNPSLRHLGRSLPEFATGRIRGCLADLARLEWALVEVFDETDRAPLQMASLQREPAIRWPRMRFRPVPAFRIVHADSRIHKLWRGDARPENMSAAPTTIRVWRGPEGRLYHAPMDPVESRGLELMCAGATFASICEAYSHLPAARAAREAASTLARWVDDGLIADFYFATRPLVVRKTRMARRASVAVSKRSDNRQDRKNRNGKSI